MSTFLCDQDVGWCWAQGWSANVLHERFLSVYDNSHAGLLPSQTYLCCCTRPRLWFRPFSGVSFRRAWGAREEASNTPTSRGDHDCDHEHMVAKIPNPNKQHQPRQENLASLEPVLPAAPPPAIELVPCAPATHRGDRTIPEAKDAVALADPARVPEGVFTANTIPGKVCTNHAYSRLPLGANPKPQTLLLTPTDLQFPRPLEQWWSKFNPPTVNPLVRSRCRQVLFRRRACLLSSLNTKRFSGWFELSGVVHWEVAWA